MGTLVKSSEKIRFKKLTDLNLQGQTAYLDFRDKTYKLASSNVLLTDIISCSRNNVAGSYNGLLEYSTVSANLPRLSTDPSTMRKGLLIEAGFTNSLQNSFTPANRSVTFALGSKIALVLECLGDGSVELFSGGVSLGTATQDSPLVYVNSTAATQNLSLSLVVNGTLNYYCLYSGSGNRKRITKIETGVSSVAYSSDLIKVNENQLANLFNSGVGCVVIKQSFPKAVFDRRLTASNIIPFFQFLEATGDNGIFLSRMENGSRPNFLRLKDNGGEKYWNISEPSESSTIAINFSKSSAKATINGIIGETLSFSSALDLTRLYLCSSGSTYTINGTQIIQEIQFFNRQLTDQELLAITTM